MQILLDIFADECIQEEFLRHEEISRLAEKRLSSEYEEEVVLSPRKDLGQLEGSPSKKGPEFSRRTWVYIHAPVRKKKGKRRK
eukprot:583452-Prorocentrum_minimum.AAC.1